mmetsp:Transcript_13607/g.53703  ORF Transcript_13607/g.53703 Transcript_13607/m.53703 type:complete len:594 (-) Transcript_13607:130-1911(-)
MNLRAVFNQLSHQVHVVLGDVLRERELLREHWRNADLGRSKVRIGHDHRAGGVIHALAHHVHAKEALLLLQLLPDPGPASLAALPGRVDQLVYAALEGEPRADRALRANLGGLRDRRRLPEEFRQGQVRLDNRVEVRVLRVFEHHVSHPARRSQLARGHEHRLHEEPGGIGAVHHGILRALGQPVRRGRRGPDHRAEVVLSRPQPLEERASLDRGDEDLLTRLLRRVVHAHLLLLVRAGVGVAVRIGGVGVVVRARAVVVGALIPLLLLLLLARVGIGVDLLPRQLPPILLLVVAERQLREFAVQVDPERGVGLALLVGQRKAVNLVRPLGGHLGRAAPAVFALGRHGREEISDEIAGLHHGVRGPHDPVLKSALVRHRQDSGHSRRVHIRHVPTESVLLELGDGLAHLLGDTDGGYLRRGVQLAGADELHLARVRRDPVRAHLESVAVEAHPPEQPDHGAEGQGVVDRDGELDVAEVARAVHGAEPARGARPLLVDGSERGIVQSVLNRVVEGVEEDGVADALDADAPRLLGVVKGEGRGHDLLLHQAGLAELDRGGLAPLAAALTHGRSLLPSPLAAFLCITLAFGRGRER